MHPCIYCCIALVILRTAEQEINQDEIRFQPGTCVKKFFDDELQRCLSYYLDVMKGLMHLSVTVRVTFLISSGAALILRSEDTSCRFYYV